MNMNNEKHGGWNDREEKLLFDEIEIARESKKPLRHVFARVAEQTGRKPNSVRNYYYMRIKDPDIAGLLGEYHSTAFVPFERDEVVDMLRFILSKHAQGYSVRACTMELGGGDTALMLRYQNKYRSIIKNDPQLVKSVIDELTESGITAFNPYVEANYRKKGRPIKNDARMIDAVAETVSNLEQVEGLDVMSLFEGLGALAVSANKGAMAIKRLNELTADSDIGALKEENSELREKNLRLEAELNAKSEQFGKLLKMFGSLMSVNRDFLELTGVVKVSSLGSYIRELTRNVTSCEKIMSEL